MKTENKNEQFCGVSEQFKNEDARGRGWCDEYKKEVLCDMVCHPISINKTTNGLH